MYMDLRRRRRLGVWVELCSDLPPVGRSPLSPPFLSFGDSFLLLILLLRFFGRFSEELREHLSKRNRLKVPCSY